MNGSGGATRDAMGVHPRGMSRVGGIDSQLVARSR